MYIKNGNQTYQCTDFNGSDAERAVIFFLEGAAPEFTDDLIQLYASDSEGNSDDFLLAQTDRTAYLREIISPFGDGWVVSYTNEPESEPVQETTEAALERTRETKIRELSQETESRITAGIDFELEPGNLEHFSFTIHDQINLSNVAAVLNSTPEMETYPYHADGSEVTEYARDHLLELHKQMTRYITGCTTCFNILKQYINSLDDLAAIAEVRFPDSLERLESSLPEPYSAIYTSIMQD